MCRRAVDDGTWFCYTTQLDLYQSCCTILVGDTTVFHVVVPWWKTESSCNHVLAVCGHKLLTMPPHYTFL